MNAGNIININKNSMKNNDNIREKNNIRNNYYMKLLVLIIF